MEIIGIYAAPTATANNVANLQVPRKGRLRGIQFAIAADLDADLESLALELSLLPVIQSNINNTRNLLASWVLSSNLTTSGQALNSICGFVPLDIPLDPLQILYVNCVMVGTTAATATLLLHFQ